MARKITENGIRRSKKAAFAQPPVQAAALEANRSTAPVNLEDEIRRRAYEIYLERGRTPGNENEDWLVAERQVRARAMSAGQSS
jgi:Protein of unknown function (DUF2934)